MLISVREIRMKSILGPFHPHLEDALVEEILNDKKADPLVPLLTLVSRRPAAGSGRVV